MAMGCYAAEREGASAKPPKHKPLLTHEGVAGGDCSASLGSEEQLTILVCGSAGQ